MEGTLKWSDVGRWNMFKWIWTRHCNHSSNQIHSLLDISIKGKCSQIPGKEVFTNSAVKLKKRCFTLFPCLQSWEKNFLWAQNHMYSMWNQPNWQHCLTMNNFLVSENAKASHIHTHSGFPFALQAQSSCWRQKSYLEQNKVIYL